MLARARPVKRLANRLNASTRRPLQTPWPAAGKSSLGKRFRRKEGPRPAGVGSGASIGAPATGVAGLPPSIPPCGGMLQAFSRRFGGETKKGCFRWSAARFVPTLPRATQERRHPVAAKIRVAVFGALSQLTQPPFPPVRWKESNRRAKPAQWRETVGFRGFHGLAPIFNRAVRVTRPA